MILDMREYRIAAILADQYQHLCGGQSCPMSHSGQSEKNSLRAHAFRFAPPTRTSLDAVGMSQTCQRQTQLSTSIEIVPGGRAAL
jgi:hypothetical protein